MVRVGFTARHASLTLRGMGLVGPAACEPCRGPVRNARSRVSTAASRGREGPCISLTSAQVSVPDKGQLSQHRFPFQGVPGQAPCPSALLKRGYCKQSSTR